MQKKTLKSRTGHHPIIVEMRGDKLATNKRGFVKVINHNNYMETVSEWYIHKYYEIKD